MASTPTWKDWARPSPTSFQPTVGVIAITSAQVKPAAAANRVESAQFSNQQTTITHNRLPHPSRGRVGGTEAKSRGNYETQRSLIRDFECMLHIRADGNPEFNLPGGTQHGRRPKAD